MSRKPTLVFLHAMGSSHAMWEAQVEEFATEFNIITPDLPGHGLNKTKFTMEGAADQVLRAIRINTSGPVHLIGASLGASVALRVAVAAPARLAGLLLTGTMVRVPHMALAAQRFATRVVPLRALAVASARTVNAAREVDRDALMSDIFNNGKATQLDALREIRDDDIAERLHRVTVPTLVCCGERDRLCMPSVDVLLKEVPKAGKKIVPEADHLWNLQRPKDFTKLVRRFVEQNPGPAPVAKNDDGQQ